MNLGRTVAVVLIGALLTTTLSAGVVLAAGHQTVLDPEFVSSSVDDAGLYEIVTENMTEQTGELATGDSAADGDTAAPTAQGGSMDAIVGGEGLGPSVMQDIVTESYLKRQTEANIDRLYSYLHGNTDELNLAVSTAPLKENTVTTVEDRIENTSTATLLEAVAEQFDTNELPEEAAGLVDPTLISTMADNRSSYRAAQEEIRSSARDQVIDQLVTQAYEESTNDQKLALVIADYDPRAYTEAEKTQLVAERESAIRSALRDQIETQRADEIDRAVEDQLATLADQTTTPTDPDANVTTATLTFQAAVVEGLAGQLTYAEFQTETTAAKSALATVVAQEAAQTFDEEVPDRVSLTEMFGSPRDFRQARQAVGILDLAAIILPVLAIVLIGLLYGVTRSAVTTMRSTGMSALLAGLPLWVGVTWASDNLRTLVPTGPAAADPMMELVMTILARILGVIGAYSLALTVLGVLLVAVSVALARGLLDAAIQRLA